MNVPEWPSSSPDGSGGDARRLALLALCVLGLLVAAFAMPTLSGAQSPGDSGNGDGGAGTETPMATPKDGDFGKDSDSLGDGGVIFEGDNPPEEGCVVALEGRRVPGAQMIAHVWKDGFPLSNRDVWFNDRYVGETDSKGRVFGRVPYQRELRVDVSVPGDASCSVVQSPNFEASDDDKESDDDTEVDVSGVSLAGFGAGGAGSEIAVDTTPGEKTASERYNVTGDENVTVVGDPYPGETVVLDARVKDVPMRNAAVHVDGERVGQTDSRGRYRLRIPADGTRSLAVEVSRGDFTGETTVRVPPLEVNVVPASLLPVPGTQATAQVTFGDSPVPDAPVTVDGERVGTTDSEGGYPLELADPRTTVRVRAEGQVATTSLWPAYANTILVVVVGSLLVVGSLATVFRRSGRRQTGGVALGWLAVALVVAGVLVVGRTGGLAILALVVLIGVAALIRYRGDEVADRLQWLAAALAALAQWVLAQTLEAARTLEAVVLWARDVPVAARNRLASLPRSASALGAQAVDWLRTLPQRARAAFDRHFDPRTAAVVGGALAVVVATTMVGGFRGFLASVGLLVVVGVAVLLRRRRPERATSERTRPTEAATDSVPEDEPKPTLRERWRTFARRVVPSGWRQRTPGEVSRAAVERGFPRESVVQFTRVFREVEFGDRPLSTERERRASEAYERLELVNQGDQSGDRRNDERSEEA